MTATAPTTAPRTGLNARFLTLEVRRLLRNRQTLIFTLALPAVLYLALYKQRAGIEAQLAHGDFAAWMMIGLAVYGAAAASTTTAAAVSVERSSGWMRTLRLTPLRPEAYTATKILSSMAVAALPVTVVGALGAATGAHAEPQVWVLSLLAAWIGSAVFAALGLALGLAFKPEIVMHMPGLLMTALAFAGNLFIPLSGTALTIAKFTPMYGVATVARYPLNEGWQFSGEHVSLLGAVANIVIWFAVFAAAAITLYRRGGGRQ
ncbi:ABC transporter [Tsukamurella pulmonis]|uniref:ABC-2 type transport system permease protein n=1 Tax=Tsukamurella pulmonis TaxID=47312 RepID=A0A1H1CDN1_9ACTN|nr:ABC transporter permease [Tsukamurella pulmonis]KXO89969.1 ABC transporter [Tsukamurella pulmonis]SDQ61756.1 ABC-2 type transport system permease protein [Tsukamurella pulmonis]SUP23903.1 ABC-type transport system involved in multi-copper enzyme maturation, permease component [Tsukamurella pulmonis]